MREKERNRGGTPSPPLYDFALFSLLVEADLPASCRGQQQQQQQQQQSNTVARISNERSRRIIDDNFEFASHYTGLEHFGLMRIKDSKAMHFISIRQTTHGRGRERSGSEGKKLGGGSYGSEISRQEGKEATAHDLYGYIMCPCLILYTFCCCF